MTLRALTYEALSFIAASGGPTNLATITLAGARQKERIASDITATLQEVYDAFPAIYRRTLGATLAAPTTITLSATNSSTTVTTSDTFTEGATVLLEGVFNQIFTENSVKRLLLPFTGTTGSVSATLYSDVVVLDSTVSEVLDQVYIVDGRRLAHRNNRADFLDGARDYPDYGRGFRVTSGKPTAGIPNSYWVEDFLLVAGTNQSAARRLRFMPLPNTQQQVTFDVRLRAPMFAVADLGTDADDSTRTFVVADNSHELIVRTLFLERWSGSPWFRDDAARKRIAEDAARARAMLSSFHSQQKRNRRITAPI